VKSVCLGLLVALLAPSLVALAQPAADQFNNIKLMVNTGGKSEPTDAILVLDKDTMTIRSKQGQTTLKSFSYASIKSAEYSYSKSPRWKSGAVAAVAVGVFAIPLFFMKGKKHWLTVGADGDFALVQLDKGNYKIILPALEARSRVKVATVGDDK
jgi:hypothetical protein